MNETKVKAPWANVVRDNVGVHLWWKIFSVILAAIFTVVGIENIPITIILALVVATLTWLAMYPNWRWVESRYPYCDVTVRRNEGWVTFFLPQKRFRLPACMVRFANKNGISSACIRFPISIFYFYSRFLGADVPQSDSEATE